MFPRRRPGAVVEHAGSHLRRRAHRIVAEVEGQRRGGAIERVVVEAADVRHRGPPRADPRRAIRPQRVVADPARRLADRGVVLVGAPEVEVAELDPVDAGLVGLDAGTRSRSDRARDPRGTRPGRARRSSRSRRRSSRSGGATSPGRARRSRTSRGTWRTSRQVGAEALEDRRRLVGRAVVPGDQVVVLLEQVGDRLLEQVAVVVTEENPEAPGRSSTRQLAIAGSSRPPRAARRRRLVDEPARCPEAGRGSTRRSSEKPSSPMLRLEVGVRDPPLPDVGSRRGSGRS